MISKNFIEFLCKKYKCVIFSKSYCPYSFRAKTLLKEVYDAEDLIIIELDLIDDYEYVDSLKCFEGYKKNEKKEIIENLENSLRKKTNIYTVPIVFIDKKLIGGSENVMKKIKKEYKIE